LLVPLGEDRALLLDYTGGTARGEKFFLELAGQFDLARIEEALAQPPRTDFTRARESIKAPLLPRLAAISKTTGGGGNESAAPPPYQLPRSAHSVRAAMVTFSGSTQCLRSAL
jgi:hypothetical protein